MDAAEFAIGAVAVSFAIALAAFIPALLRLAILPAVVLEILFGVVIGPQGMGLVHHNEILDVLSELGLAILFLIAGLEINPGQVRGAPTRLALRGWALSLAIGLVLGFGGQALGLFSGGGFIAIAIATTAIGALMPILKDAGLLAPPYGPFVLASGAVGEALPLVAFSLVLAGVAGLGTQSVVLVVFAATGLLAIALAGRIRQLPLPPLFRATMSSSGQFPIRFAVFLTISFALFGQSLGLDLVLGAFVAGAVLRTLLPHDLHDDLMERLSAVGYGFLIPIFFVTSGAELDIEALAGSQTAIALVPVFVVMMLLARGVPALFLYRDALSVRQRIALAFHSGTQLPLVVAIAAIAVDKGAMPGWCGASLVMAGVVTVIVFPGIAALALRKDMTRQG
jgi:Kef-type K+ transport system membrane component KefB